MRAANFDFAQGRLGDGFAMTNRILAETEVFDQILFSYLSQTGLPVSSLAGVAVPAVPRVARAWLSWLHDSCSEEDLDQLWSWMRQERLLDQKSATVFAWAFWRRGAFTAAQDSWADWLGSTHVTHAGYLHPQRLANIRFDEVLNQSPFDWMLTEGPAVEIRRNDGVEIRFSGNSNLDLSDIRQFATVRRGDYRFSADRSRSLFPHLRSAKSRPL
jgi:hypothetical protein